MRSATPSFFTTFASTKSLMRQRSSQHLKNVAASLYESCSCDTVKAVDDTPTQRYGPEVEGIAPDHRPDFVTKLERAAAQIRGAAEQLRDTDKPIWAVVDGFYAKRPVLKEAQAQGVIVVGRLRCDA